MLIRKKNIGREKEFLRKIFFFYYVILSFIFWRKIFSDKVRKILRDKEVLGFLLKIN